MEYSAFKHLVQQTFTSLLPDFICITSGDFPYFEKRAEELVQYIRFAVTVGAGQYRLYGIVPSIQFVVVESFLAPFNSKYNLSNEGDKTPTIYGSIYNVGKYALHDDNAVWVNQASDLRAIGPLLKDNMEQIALPFFQRFTSLQQVHSYVESLPLNNMSVFLSGNMPFKRLVIKKLCGDKGWSDWGKTVLQTYREKAKHNPALYKNLEGATLELM